MSLNDTCLCEFDKENSARMRQTSGTEFFKSITGMGSVSCLENYNSLSGKLGDIKEKLRFIRERRQSSTVPNERNSPRKLHAPEYGWEKLWVSQARLQVFEMVSKPERFLAWANSLGLSADGKGELPVSEIQARYDSVKSECFNFLVDSTTVDLNKFNPLSKVTAGNPWSTQYDNQSRLSEIKLDVDRTYQEVAFFSKNSSHQQSLINVLFVFTKTVQLGYRQGMNEICAILFYASVEFSSNVCGTDSAAEALTYELFHRLMIDRGHIDMFHTRTKSEGGSPLLVRCENVFELLESRDPRVHRHLVMNEISSNLFLVRWIRLLFSREFSFGEIFTVWDFLLENHDIVNSMAVAMIIAVRQDLLQSDNSGCFTKLLQYPSQNLPQLFQLAIRVRENTLNEPTKEPTKVESTRRGRVVAELSEVIGSLKRNPYSPHIRTELVRLDEILSMIKLPQ